MESNNQIEVEDNASETHILSEPEIAEDGNFSGKRTIYNNGEGCYVEDATCPNSKVLGSAGNIIK